jgi:GNAT superfamily N-acetyltransferase
MRAAPDGIAMITVMLHREDIGRLAYQVCGTCRKALICKQSIDQEYQGPGLGRRVLLAALATAPDHEWTAAIRRLRPVLAADEPRHRRIPHRRPRARRTVPAHALTRTHDRHLPGSPVNPG